MPSVHLGIIVSLTEHVYVNCHFEIREAEHMKYYQMSVEIQSGDYIYWPRNALNKTLYNTYHKTQLMINVTATRFGTGVSFL